MRILITLSLFPTRITPPQDSPKAVSDEKGNIVKSNISSKKYEFSEYKYDEQGNWVLRKIYQVDIQKNGKHTKTLKQKYKRKLVYRE